MDRAQGYSIWIVPDSLPLTLSTRYIHKYAMKFHSPVFTPHLTLIGNINQNEERVISLTYRLAKQIKACKIRFYKVGHDDSFFTSLFLQARLTPRLKNMYNLSKQIFKLKNTLDYVPHLSLMYGKISLKSKIDIMSKLKVKPQDFDFYATELQVHKTNGRVKNWKKIASFTF